LYVACACSGRRDDFIFLFAERKELIDVDGFIFTLFWLVLIFVGIGWLVKKMKEHKREFAATIKGAIAIVEVDNGNKIMKLDYDSKVYVIDKFTLQGVTLGRAVSQQGSQARIALAGNWERVDENTIRGIVDTFKGRDHSKYPSHTEWVLKIGESFPLGFVAGRSMKYIKASTSQAKVIDLYIPDGSSAS